MSNYAIAESSSPVTGIVAFLSSTEREGHWELPRHVRALAVLGNVELDLRNAIVGVGLYVIEAVAVLGNVEITVPPELHVECDGDALMGSFTLHYEGRVDTAAANREHTIRVTGSAYVASVTVRVKGPDEDVLSKLGRTLGFKRVAR
ncbi:MAG: cell wall-active antibiotics response protein [Gemmatimonadota bacterium]|nr:cell wall-active antibiotics response protein [Gemmatimonadota bacterium]